MAQWATLLLLLMCGFGQFSMAINESCEDHGMQMDRVFSVQGETALLTCPVLLQDSAFLNITWFKEHTELWGRQGRFWTHNENLWILKSRLQDTGHYVCQWRWGDRCVRQMVELSVSEMQHADCGRPHRAEQMLNIIANGWLSCPLQRYMALLDSYTYTWYKGCELIAFGEKFQRRNHMLLITYVTLSDAGTYTCRMTFDLGGTTVSVSETITLDVKESWNLEPSVSEPTNDLVKANYGSSFSKRCRVFVPGAGNHSVDVAWATDSFISDNPAERINQGPLSQTRVKNGEWLELALNFTQVKEEDFYNTYRCVVLSDRGQINANFTLLPADRNLAVPLGFFFIGSILLFAVTVVAYKALRVDMTLLCRTIFTHLYTDPGKDGKLYDAYVAYPRSCGGGACTQLEMFALHTLPHLLEQQHGYKLFILGRDAPLGAALADAVTENIGRSRRLLLLYSTSSFTHLDWVQTLERQAGLHAALLDGSVRPILVELGEEPRDSALPQSVRHLRSRQGAVRWRGGGRSSTGHCGDTSFSLPNASSRFWKHLRYHMPPRGGASVPPEKSILLDV